MIIEFDSISKMKSKEDVKDVKEVIRKAVSVDESELLEVDYILYGENETVLAKGVCAVRDSSYQTSDICIHAGVKFDDVYSVEVISAIKSKEVKPVYVWKQITSEGRLINPKPRKNNDGYDVYLEGGCDNVEDSEFNLSMWMADTEQGFFDEELTLIKVYK